MDTHETTQSHRLLARMTAQPPAGTLTLTAQLAADPAEVWSALTTRSRLAQWLGDLTGDLSAGGRYQISYHASGAEGAGTITQCEPPHHIQVTTTDPDGSNEGSLTLNLTACSDGTELIVTQQGLPLEWLPAFAAGYQVRVEDLALHLAGRGRCDSDARMAVLVPQYENEPVG